MSPIKVGDVILELYTNKEFAEKDLQNFKIFDNIIYGKEVAGDEVEATNEFTIIVKKL